MQYMDSAASHMVSVAFYPDSSAYSREIVIALHTALESLSRNQLATSFVNPNRSIASAQRIEPTSIYGLRRPKRDVDESATAPIRG